MGDGRSAFSALMFGGPAGLRGGSPRKGRRPRALARKDEAGAKLGWWQRRARLGARSVVTRRRSGSCGSRAQGPLSSSGSQVSLFLARVGRTCTLDRRVNE